MIAIKATKFWQRLRTLKRLIHRFVFLFGLITLVGLTALGITTYQLIDSIPSKDSLSFNKVRGLAQALSIANAINSKQSKPGSWTELKDVSTELLYALVISEDETFFNHRGIDYNALVAALVHNVKTRKWRFEASTITQQTAKSLFLSDNTNFTHKVQEGLITYRLEHTISKNEILELYFNIIEFGPEIYGIANACAYFFNKPPSEINAVEGAYLAQLMHSPGNNHHATYKNSTGSPAVMKKLHRTLREMRFKGLIKEDQYKRYLNWEYKDHK